MLGDYSLSQAPLSAFIPNGFISGTAAGVAIVSGVSVGRSSSVGTSLGVATVMSIDLGAELFSILRGMNKQPVNATALISNTPISILGNF